MVKFSPYVNDYKISKASIYICIIQFTQIKCRENLIRQSLCSKTYTDTFVLNLSQL